ncbi:hypothetical protein JRQ81_016375 [Phrynocephalus forsythii]|uniref:Uncharacterized protein n=1 Tax=Phrynocephalus forsythii TaxID=171643 RepID=A0A9Q1B124_9SAUR|nr:hypothetical protein JRQ81_016375 [Phrynocephalus forsythii]
MHTKHVVANAQKSIGAILKIFWTRGGRNVIAANRLYLVKVLPQMTYGAAHSIPVNLAALEKQQSKFLRAILWLPTSASNAAIRLETGQVTVEARIWIMAIMYWLKLNHDTTGLLPLTLQDTYAPPAEDTGTQVRVLWIFTTLSVVN